MPGLTLSLLNQTPQRHRLGVHIFSKCLRNSYSPKVWKVLNEGLIGHWGTISPWCVLSAWGNQKPVSPPNLIASYNEIKRQNMDQKSKLKKHS